MVLSDLYLFLLYRLSTRSFFSILMTVSNFLNCLLVKMTFQMKAFCIRDLIFHLLTVHLLETVKILM